MKGKDTVFFLPERFEPNRLSKSLKNLTLKVEPAAAEQTFDVLDCHDQSIRASGDLLIQSGGALRIFQGRGGTAWQRTTGKEKFVQDLPDGSVKAALKTFPRLRALTSVGKGTLQTQWLVVLDDQLKTQVRGTVLSFVAGEHRASVVIVHKMKGYDRAFKAVCKTLGTLTSEASGVETLFDALYPGMVPYQAKPEISLGKTEPSIEVATDIIRTFLAVARQNEAGVIADIDTEYLHDYRVSLRRVRSVLSLFKGVFSIEQTIALKHTFSDLMAPTGRVRDLDVYLLDKDIYFNLITSNLHLGAEAMFHQFEQERSQAFNALSRRFKSAAYDRRMNELTALFADVGNLEPGPNATREAYGYACALIWKRYRKVCKLARQITPDTPDGLVHDLRIDCKKLRYLMEFFGPLFDARDFKKIIKPLKKLQDSLGVFNDCSVQQEALLEFVARQSDTQKRANAQLAMSVGGLVAVLDQRQKSERDRIIANFRHFDSPDIRHLFRSLFHHKED